MGGDNSHQVAHFYWRATGHASCRRFINIGLWHHSTTKIPTIGSSIIRIILIPTSSGLPLMVQIRSLRIFRCWPSFSQLPTKAYQATSLSFSSPPLDWTIQTVVCPSYLANLERSFVSPTWCPFYSEHVIARHLTSRAS